MYEKARRIAGLWLSERLLDLVFQFSILLSRPTFFAIEHVNPADALRGAFFPFFEKLVLQMRR